MTTGIDADANLQTVIDATREAAQGGAKVLFTPEMSILLDQKRKRAAEWIDNGGPDRAKTALADAAREHGVDIALGSMPVPTGEDRWANRAMYFRASDTGTSPAISYDKIHMFDAELGEGDSWQESAAYRPGGEVVAVGDTPVGKLGLTICYDLRFPALFDALGRAKCDCIATPAAFTVPTGKAHWHVLQRARAIEASAFVVAAAQVGEHEDGRSTYGHSLVIDPWGDVLLDMGSENGVGFCDIDLGRVDDVRKRIPSLANKCESLTAPGA
ncbi:Carbon-nitrogen hydrolase [Aurantiacibacter gangjinensis]|nr:Carbon-nitrogen hydrolase [Aurantiacibacter gangjinensis]